MATLGRLFAAAAFTAVAVAPASAWAAATSLGTAYYSPTWKVVVIPYHGPLPAYVLGTANNPPRVYLDFNAAYAVGTRHGRASGHPVLKGWSMAPRNPNTTRVTLDFTRPTAVRVVHNAQKKLIMLVPQVGTASKPAPARAPQPGLKLGPARWDPDRKAVAIPYKGELPAHEMGILNNPPRVFVDLAGAGPKDPASRAVKGHPTLVRIETAARSANSMRVVLTFKATTDVNVQNDHVRREVLLVPLNTAPTPAPQPAATPDTPELPPPELQDPTLAPPRPTAPEGGDPTLEAP